MAAGVTTDGFARLWHIDGVTLAAAVEVGDGGAIRVVAGCGTVHLVG
jgi:hypothetical protein